MCLIASLTAQKEFVKCGNHFEKPDWFFFPSSGIFSKNLILQIEHHLYPIYQAKYCHLSFVRSPRTLPLPLIVLQHPLALYSQLG